MSPCHAQLYPSVFPYAMTDDKARTNPAFYRFVKGSAGSGFHFFLTFTHAAGQKCIPPLPHYSLVLYYKVHDFFDAILKAITDQQPLRIAYRKFDSLKNDEHVLHPYFLKEYRGRWYVLGHSEARH